MTKFPALCITFAIEWGRGSEEWEAVAAWRDQFVNLFRLRTFIAAETGLFDGDGGLLLRLESLRRDLWLS